MTDKNAPAGRTRPFALTMLSSVLLAPFVMGGVAQGETLEDALVAAYRNNPTLEEARLGVRAAREDRVQARSAYLPSLDVTASYGARELEIEQKGGDTPATQRTDLEPSTTAARLSQPILTGGRRGAQMRLSRASMENAAQGLRAAEQEVLLAAIEAYVSVRRDEEIVHVREDYVEGLERQRSGTQRRLDVGEVTRTDLAQAEARLAGARAGLASARAELQASRARYVEVIGAEPGELAPALPPTDTPATMDEAVDRAQSDHPLLLQSRQGENAARARVGLERSALLPKLSIVGRFERAEDEIFIDEVRESSSAVAEVSVPLFEGGYAWSRTAQSRLNVRRAEAMSESRRREIVAGVVAAWNAVSASREVLSAAREQVGAADAALKGAQREQGLGLRSTIDVLDAEREWQEALIGRARAEADAVLAAHRLLSASGSLSMDTLGIPAPDLER